MLKARDYEAASGFLRELYAHRDPDTLPALAIRGMHRLIGADQATWNEMALSVPWAHVVAHPPQSDAGWVTRTFAAHMNEHPSIRAWREERRARVRAISDYVSRREYRRSAIYQRLYRHLGYEDQLAPALTPPQGHALALAFGRSRWGVSARDREMAGFLAPHVLQAYRNVAALARARRAVAGYREVADALGLCVIELDRHGRPLDCPSRARRWLGRYFADVPPRGADGLPLTLAAWVRQRLGYAGEAAGQPPLVRRRGARRLTVRCFPLEGGGALLTLEECIDARRLRPGGLTRREVEVLMELRAGKTNDEIAAGLCISPGTVKKHLDNVYAKLGVSNRTAAVAQLQELRAARGDPA